MAQSDTPIARAALLSALQIEEAKDQAERAVHALLPHSKVSRTQGDLSVARTYSDKATVLAQQLGYADVITEAKLQHAAVQAVSGRRNLFW